MLVAIYGVNADFSDCGDFCVFGDCGNPGSLKGASPVELGGWCCDVVVAVATEVALVAVVDKDKRVANSMWAL